MIKRTKFQWVNLIARGVLLLAMAIVIAIPQAALAQSAPTDQKTNVDPKAPKIDYSANDINYYDPRGNNVCGATAKESGDTLTRFLQALADQESGGDPKAQSGGSSASGKYQYIDSTWQGVTNAYPPAKQYSRAKDAPEEYQDAVAYIEYAAKFKTFNGDLVKLAVSHYYPPALTNPSLMDVIPAQGAGNVLTPRGYAEAFVQRMNSGAGKNIPIKAAQAPQFAEFLAKVNAQPGSTGGTDNNTCQSKNGVVSGDIVKTALGLAWPDRGHGYNKSDATTAYQSAMPKYNPSSAKANDYPYSDCGVFVATVITATYDPNYQKRGTSSQIDYIQNHPEKFTFFTSSDYTQSTEKLQPGDILIKPGHTYLFTGPYKGSDGKLYNSASASWNSPGGPDRGHVPEATNWYSGFSVARVKK